MNAEKPVVNNPTDEPTISTDTEPTMFEKVTNQPWFGWATKVVVAIVLIVVIFFGARWIHHRSNHGAVNNPRGANTATPPLQPNGSSATPKKSTGGSSNSGSTPGSAGSGKGPGSANQNQQLSDTGPGDVAVIFLAASFVAAGLHYAVKTRRAS